MTHGSRGHIFGEEKEEASFNGFQFILPKDAVNDCSHQGACDTDVAFWCDYVDWTQATEEQIRAELAEYGAWSEEDLQDVQQNRHRLLWVAACNVKEEREQK